MEFIDLKAQYADLAPRIRERIDAVLAHGKFILGPEVAELEERLAEYVGVGHCIGVASGTDALVVALMALEVGPGDEVVTTPFSFIATAEAILLLGARPVFCDIDPATCNLDPAGLEAVITPRTRAILPVSLYGQCADLEAISRVAARHGLPVVEDAAQSFGATTGGRRSCGLTTLACTSFFPSKPLGCYGDGGAVFTDDGVLAERARQIRVHGQSRRYYHARLGINGRLDTLQAAILLAKLEAFPGEVEARGRVGARYSQLLAGVVGVPWVAPGNTSVYAQYTVRVADREGLRQALTEAGVPTAVHYPVPLTRQPAVLAAGPQGTLPAAERAAAEVLSLPMSPWLAAADQDRVVDAVRVWAASAADAARS